MECINPEFSGTGVTIAYKTNIQGSVPGDVLTGELYIVSDMGEYVIPYVINVAYENIESSLGPIKNMFHFTNLAKSNWDEAVSVFYNSEFIRVYETKYRALLQSIGSTFETLEVATAQEADRLLNFDSKSKVKHSHKEKKGNQNKD